MKHSDNNFQKIPKKTRENRKEIVRNSVPRNYLCRKKGKTPFTCLERAKEIGDLYGHEAYVCDCGFIHLTSNKGKRNKNYEKETSHGN